MSGSISARPVYMSTSINARPVYMSTSINAEPVYTAGCFPKSALVRLSSDRLVPIESIQIGDVLDSWDIEQQRPQSAVVTQTHHHQVMALIHINGSFDVSTSQPLLIIERSQKLNITVPSWRYAHDIHIGDLILGYGGEPITVDSKSVTMIELGVDVMQLSTYRGAPFFVENILAGANNDSKAPQAAMREATKCRQGVLRITDDRED